MRVLIMGVMLQAFYWDCPVVESREHQWWIEIKNRIPQLQQVGVHGSLATACQQGSLMEVNGPRSLRFYDLGEFNQKGGGANMVWFQGCVA